MSKRYLDTIEIEASSGTIEAFLWRGKRYIVRRVLARWRETGGWWRGSETDRPWAGGHAHEIVRVDAVALGPLDPRGTARGARGVYEIARDLRSGAWSMRRVLD